MNQNTNQHAPINEKIADTTKEQISVEITNTASEQIPAEINNQPPHKKTVSGVDVSSQNSTESSDDKDNTKTASVSPEDNLELRRMKWAARIKAKRERLKTNTEGMTNCEKFKYYVYYYKWHVILGALAIFCIIAIPTAIYKNSRPVSISYAVVNSPAPEKINEKLFNKYAAYYNLVDGYQIRNSIYVTLSQEDYENEFGKEEGDSSYTQFPTLCWNNYFDIIITNETGLNYCSVNGLIQPIEDRLYDDIYTAIKDKYPKAIVTSLNYDEDPVEYAIDISNTQFAKDLNVGYDKVYVCFPGESEQNIVNVRRFLNYVLELNIEI